jgi:uncharacterized protein RhaS with RHS repeats
LGLYYLRARYYNPATGRFLSRDPEDGKTKDPASLHKYLYANGDPVNRIDPRGRATTLQFAFNVYVVAWADMVVYSINHVVGEKLICVEVVILTVTSPMGRGILGVLCAGFIS